MSTVPKNTVNQSQKLMIFVLSMSLYGLATLFTELIPKFQVGLVEFSVEYFLFIPLTLAMLFDPLSAALGAATGELVFSEIMLGQFGGLGEVEKFLTVTIGVYIAGRLVRDPKNRVMVGAAAITGTAAQLLMGTIVDIAKVQLAVSLLYTSRQIRPKASKHWTATAATAQVQRSTYWKQSRNTLSPIPYR